MRKIGLCLHPGRSIENIDDQLRLMKQYGFDSTFAGDTLLSEKDPAAIADLIAKHGISYESIHAPFRHINDIWFDIPEGQQMLEELKVNVDRCALSNVPTLVTHLSSSITPPAPTDIGRSRFIELVEYAAKKNVNIAFENLRTLANLAWAFEEFDKAENVGFCWDCGHEYCFTPGQRYMPLFGHKLIFTHIHDNTCEYDRDRHLIPFDGSMPFDFIAQQLKDSGYQGTLMSESFPRFTPGIYNSYQDCTTEEFIRRSADAMKKLRIMVDGESEIL